MESILADLAAALDVRRSAVLVAPPGAGKSTIVPLFLQRAEWLSNRRIVMLAPRRLAARSAARRLADNCGERVGQTVGYRVRLDSRVGPETRIEVVTEGVLTRMLQSDPGLAGVGLVIFDEFHERHLDSDLGLALCLDIQGVLNPDLRILVMSATIDAASIAAHMGDAPVIRCEGRQHPVETRYRPPWPNRPIEAAVISAIHAAAASDGGSQLVFLPGAAWIRRVADALSMRLPPGAWIVSPLYGNLSKEAQDRAVAPAPPGMEKIVLSTPIAETSLTIEGIRVVIDSGLCRTPRYDPRSGMTRLVTIPISRASADQRRGRAGRTGPGICYRLWAEADQYRLPERSRPEILEADLTGLALELARWGEVDPRRLRWLDPPPAGTFAQAREVLTDLGALDAQGGLTAHGRGMAELPVHPRLAHMALMAKGEGVGAEAALLAALLGERDVLRLPAGVSDVDLQSRVALLADPAGRPARDGRFDGAVPHGLRRQADRLRRRLGIGGIDAIRLGVIGRLVAWAYPDRIAMAQPGERGLFRLANGRAAFVPPEDPLAGEKFLAVADLDGNPRKARIHLAAVYDEESLDDQFAPRIDCRETIAWDARQKAVVSIEERRLGAIVLKRRPLSNPDTGRILDAMIDGIRREGIFCLPWRPTLRAWQQRVMFLRRVFGEAADWPDVSDAALSGDLENWLAPWLTGMSRLTDLKRIDLAAALRARLSWARQQDLDRLAPERIAVPSGSRLAIDYSGEVPVLAVRIQEMFGTAETPVIAGGRVPLLLHLLSPAGRPMQVTRDLAGFWQTGYHEVRKDLRGRYPKHPWPEDPMHAPPTTRTKKRPPC